MTDSEKLKGHIKFLDGFIIASKKSEQDVDLFWLEATVKYFYHKMDGLDIAHLTSIRTILMELDA